MKKRLVIVFHDIHHQQRPNCTGLNTKENHAASNSKQNSKRASFWRRRCPPFRASFSFGLLSNSMSWYLPSSLLVVDSFSSPQMPGLFLPALSSFFMRPDARYNQEKGPFLLPMTSFLSDEARAGIFCGVASETNLSLRCHCSTLLGQQCNMISALFVQAF